MITIKTKEEIEAMAEGGKILEEILSQLKERVVVGVTTLDIDKLARELILKFGVKSSFLGYNNYPAVICTSINDELVHAIPSSRKLKEGDVLKLDFGVIHKLFHTDSAITLLVSENDNLKQYKDKLNLISVTEESLNLGIEKAVVGNHIGDIGNAIQSFVESKGLNVSRELVGHGVGKKLHEEPYVPNYGRPGQGELLKEGMVIAIEPIVMVGSWETKDSPDGFGFLTVDGSLAAHFEHTVAVTKKGPKILTK